MSKSVRISFHSLSQRIYSNAAVNPGEELPLLVIAELLDFICKRSRKNRIFNLKDNKFCLLEGFHSSSEEGIKVITGILKSARRQFRPNLINGVTATERENPKERMEGDVEKTHFAIRIDEQQDEVYLLLEFNYHGLTIQNFANYLSHFAKLYHEKKGESKRYSIQHSILARQNFLQELERLNRSILAEVYVNKRILGSEVLNLSNRTIPVKKYLKLTAFAEVGENITNFVVDTWNSMSDQENSEVAKIRVKGKDTDNNNVTLDTSFLSKKEFIDIEVNPITGDLNSTQIGTELRRIALDF